MSKNRLWLIGAALIMVVIAGGGWLIGIQPQLSAASLADQTRVNVEAQNAGHEALLIKLKKDYEGIEALKGQLAALRIAVPASAEMPSFVTELNSLAGSHNVTVKSITVADAKPYAPVPATGGGTSNTPANSRINAENFVAIPVQLAVTGPYANVLDFVHDVQTSARLFLVATLSTTGSTHSKGSVSRPTTSGPDTVDATVGGFVYVLLDNGKK